jgi:hypothetical protein
MPYPHHVWRALCSWYFEPKPFEKAADCRLYRLLGVRTFKRYLPTSGDLVSRWRGVSRICRADGGLAPALRRYERVTRSYEVRHIFGAFSMFAVSWWAIVFHGKGQWPALIVANVFINGYPILLQRYNRIRLQNALAHLAALHDCREAARPSAPAGGESPPTA